jgi:hypothetical protein
MNYWKWSNGETYYQSARKPSIKDSTTNNNTNYDTKMNAIEQSLAEDIPVAESESTPNYTKPRGSFAGAVSPYATKQKAKEAEQKKKNAGARNRIKDKVGFVQSNEEQHKQIMKQQLETETRNAQDQLIIYLDPIGCSQSEFSTTYNWLVRDGLSVDSNLWRPYSSSKLWPRQCFLINPVYKALSAIEIITDHQKEYWTQFGKDTTPPQDSVGWTAMIDRIIVQPAVSKLLTLQVNNLVPFSVEALHYKSGEPTTGYHKDPPAYKAIACLTLEGSGSISIGNRKSTKETSRELGRGESYLLLGDALEKWQHRVGLEKSGDRVVLVVRFVERAIMEAIITIRDADLILQKPHRFPKRARKA